MIKPFRADIPQARLDDFRARLEQTRWPDDIPGSGWRYGASLPYMKELHHYWLTQFDWRKTEAEINRHDNFIADIDGNHIHFIHAKSQGKTPVPIIITHGWPGSFLEMLRIVPLLTEDAGITFDVVIPSMIGYGFSSKPTADGCHVGYMADLWVKLMHELGYDRFVVQGGDFGAGVSTAIALQAPESVIAMHLNYIPGNYMPDLEFDSFTDEEEDYLASAEEWYTREGGYSLQQKTKPLTLAYGLHDSPLGLCAWIVEKMLGWADPSGNIESAFSKDDLLANVTLYWLTDTAHSSMRLYVENTRYPLRLGGDNCITVPVGIARFKYEEPFPPRRFVERGYKNIQHWTDFPTGGHFAAMERPLELAQDIKAFLQKLKAVKQQAPPEQPVRELSTGRTLPLTLSESQIKEIAGFLEGGFQCYVHKLTGQIEFLPDELDLAYDPEPWQDLIDSIEEDIDSYAHLEKMDSSQAFRIMEDFVASLQDGAFKRRLDDILSRPKPFKHFKATIDDSDFRQDWFDFRLRANMEWVREQLEAINEDHA